jgi:hypothetical protein
MMMKKAILRATIMGRTAGRAQGAHYPRAGEPVACGMQRGALASAEMTQR